MWRGRTCTYLGLAVVARHHWYHRYVRVGYQTGHVVSLLCKNVELLDDVVDKEMGWGTDCVFD